MFMMEKAEKREKSWLMKKNAAFRRLEITMNGDYAHPDMYGQC